MNTDELNGISNEKNALYFMEVCSIELWPILQYSIQTQVIAEVILAVFDTILQYV